MRRPGSVSRRFAMAHARNQGMNPKPAHRAAGGGFIRLRRGSAGMGCHGCASSSMNRFPARIMRLVRK